MKLDIRAAFSAQLGSVGKAGLKFAESDLESQSSTRRNRGHTRLAEEEGAWRGERGHQLPHLTLSGILALFSVPPR